jgi:hypothetical protein
VSALGQFRFFERHAKIRQNRTFESYAPLTVYLELAAMLIFVWSTTESLRQRTEHRLLDRQAERLRRLELDSQLNPRRRPDV